MSTIVLVTGGNRGIGYAIVRAIANRIPQAIVILGCRDIASGETALKQLKADGFAAELQVVQLDIEDDNSIADAVDTVQQRFGKLDILVNNAVKLERPETRQLADLRATSNACYNNAITSNAIMTEAFLPTLRKSSWPRVVMVSSTRGSMGLTASKQLPAVAVVDYCIAKAGLNMLTLHLQRMEDQKPEGERVTFWAVSPGHCKTGFNNFRGRKDPLEGAEVVVRLLEAERGAIQGGTFWEFENGAFQEAPW